MHKMNHPFEGPFVFTSDQNILKPKDLGLVNGHLAIGTPYTSVARVEGLFAPPYASSDFALDIRFMGELVACRSFAYQPNALHRAGRVGGIEVDTLTVLPSGMRSAIVKVSLTNTTDQGARVPIQIWLGGGLDYVHQWEFGKPTATKAADLLVSASTVEKINNDKAWILGTTMEGLAWFDAASLWEGEIHLAAGESTDLSWAIGIGPVEQARAEQETILRDPDAAIRSAAQWLAGRTEALFKRLPRFSCDDPRLTAFYERSLTAYITNRWQVDEFRLNPYLSTGSINGGCLCSYLWDYSGGWKLHPLIDPALNAAQIKQFLRIDLSRAFAFTPVDGAAYGPWYPCNQEKIIALVYYHVLHTGDVGFLHEEVLGRTILDHVVAQALLKDDVDAPFALYDYGVDGEHHLELRRGIPYHGILPDLNARRYLGYTRAYALTALAGAPAPALLERARILKDALRRDLWDDEKKWFRFVAGGRADLRYTVQMFKLLDSPVLDDDMVQGLLSHLNETEFLSEFGLHSMSKQDPAYDQVDIDNGGGGICTLFVPLIAEKLYSMGHGREANDLLRRCLWWGERVPYWGDSFAANAVEYRQDTPLQATIGGVVGAQAVIFGMFGIQARTDGSIEINPFSEQLAHGMRLSGVRLLGRTFDVALQDDVFSVSLGDTCHTSAYGTPITI